MHSSSRFAKAARGLALAALLTAPAILPAQSSGELPDQASRRLQYLYAERAYPFDQIPQGALMNAKRQLEAQFGLMNRRAVASLSGVRPDPSWVEIGPGTISNVDAGRVTAIAVHPTNRSIIYAGGAQGGIWKTTNGGLSWAALSDGECSLAVGAIAIDPVNPEIVYVATGEQNNSADSYYGCGVLRSTNGGLTWTQLGASVFVTPFASSITAAGARIGRIIVDPRTAGGNNTTVIVASNIGIFRSINSGATWIQTSTFHVSALLFDPGNPNTVWMAVDDARTTGTTDRGIHKSTDNGISWTQTSFGLPAGATGGRIELAISRSNPSVMYAAVEDRTTGTASPGALLGVWRTADGGATWEQRVSPGSANITCNVQCWYDMVLAVDPSNPDQVYFGGLRLYRSVDGAVTFTTLPSVGSGYHDDQHVILLDAIDPGSALVGNDGGVYKTASIAATSPVWSSLNTNMGLTQFYGGISLHPTDANQVIGGTQDNGTLFFSGTPVWTRIVGGDGGFTAINPQTPAIAWAETQWDQGSGPGPRRRPVGSTTFSIRRNGIDVNDAAQFIPPLVMDLARPSIVYFGTTKLYRTYDDGLLWSPILAQAGKATTATVTAIGPAPSDSATIYVGTTDGNIQVTSDAGLTWVQRIGGIPNRVIKDFAVDATNPSRAWTVVSGFGSGHVFRTTDKGASWTDISTNLPNVPVNAIVAIPVSGDLYVGTDLGVFRSTTGGTSWTPFMEGFPNVAVFDLAFNDRTRVLVAGTHGRGMFSYTLPANVLRGDVNGDGVITAADAQLVLTYSVGLALPAGATAYPNGDANCDGVTSVLDAQIILSFVVGAPTTQFCVGTVR